MSMRGLRQRATHEVVVDGLGRSAIEHHDAADRDPAAIERERGAAAAERGDDAAPVRVAAMHRRLHQRALRDDPCGDTGLLAVGSAVDGDAEVPCRALGVGDKLLGQ